MRRLNSTRAPSEPSIVVAEPIICGRCNERPHVQALPDALRGPFHRVVQSS
jgi:hypothetical protein